MWRAIQGRSLYKVFPGEIVSLVEIFQRSIHYFNSSILMEELVDQDMFFRCHEDLYARIRLMILHGMLVFLSIRAPRCHHCRC